MQSSPPFAHHHHLRVCVDRYRAPEVLLQATEYNAPIGKSGSEAPSVSGPADHGFSPGLGTCMCQQEVVECMSMHLWLLDCRHVGSRGHHGGVVHTATSVPRRQVGSEQS